MNLHKIRLQKNLSIVKLQEKTKVPFHVLQNWERCGVVPKADHVIRIAIGLDVTVAELMGGEPA